MRVSASRRSTKRRKDAGQNDRTVIAADGTASPRITSLTSSLPCDGLRDGPFGSADASRTPTRRVSTEPRHSFGTSKRCTRGARLGCRVVASSLGCTSDLRHFPLETFGLRRCLRCVFHAMRDTDSRRSGTRFRTKWDSAPAQRPASPSSCRRLHGPASPVLASRSASRMTRRSFMFV